MDNNPLNEIKSFVEVMKPAQEEFNRNMNSAIDRNTTTTVNFSEWGPPVHLATNVFPDRIEIDYRAERNWPSLFSHPPKVWREIWTAVEGKLVKEIKEGQYHAPQGEQYTFE